MLVTVFPTKPIAAQIQQSTVVANTSTPSSLVTPISPGEKIFTPSSVVDNRLRSPEVNNLEMIELSSFDEQSLTPAFPLTDKKYQYWSVNEVNSSSELDRNTSHQSNPQGAATLGVVSLQDSQKHDLRKKLVKQFKENHKRITSLDSVPFSLPCQLETFTQEDNSCLSSTYFLANNNLPNRKEKYRQQEIEEILNQLEELPSQEFTIPVEKGYLLSPAMTISNPNGYGADNNTAFISASYQNRTRFVASRRSDGEMGFGIGVGDAVRAIGVELAYTINTFGTSSGGFGDLEGFGSGGFSIKVHRRITEDFAVAAGWNQFARIERNPDAPLDYPDNSYYAVATKIFKTREFISQPLSRVVVTAGVGSGQFLPFDQIQTAVANNEEPTGLGMFGSIAVRVLRPVSAIVEWTGQDLGMGLSIVPFRNIPIVITPGIRDITGAGDGVRFIMGIGMAIQL